MGELASAPLVLGRRQLLGWGGALVVAAASGGVQACGEAPDESHLDRVRAAGVLRVAIANESPYGYVGRDGALAGAFPDIVRAVATGLGVAGIEGVVVSFDALIDTLVAGRVDIVAAGMTVTPERCALVDFGRPELRALTALAVPRDDPLALSDYASIISSGAYLGVLGGAIEGDDAVAAGVASDHVVRFLDVQEMVPSLVSGDIDAIALTARSIRELVAATGAGALVALPSFAPTIDGRPVERVAALAFPAGDRSLLDAFESVAGPLRRDGTIAAVFHHYGWTDDDLPTGEQPLACST